MKHKVIDCGIGKPKKHFVRNSFSELTILEQIRKHSVRVERFICASRPCSALPAPRLKRHSERPMPRGCPCASVCMEKSQSAIFVCSCSLGHRPMVCIDQASLAPKWRMVCRGLLISTTKSAAPAVVSAERNRRKHVVLIVVVLEIGNRCCVVIEKGGSPLL